MRSNSTLLPRDFVLRLELAEEGRKGGDEGTVSWGPTDPDDGDMVNWTASVTGPPDTAFAARTYQLSIECGPRYPDKPPLVRFVTKVNMSCVDGESGAVRTPYLARWSRANDEISMRGVLLDLRMKMQHVEERHKEQPEGNFQTF